MSKHKHNGESDEPFNDAMEHMNHIEGYPINKGGKLPLPIKIIGFCLFGGIIMMLLFGVIANFIFN